MAFVTRRSLLTTLGCLPVMGTSAASASTAYAIVEIDECAFQRAQTTHDGSAIAAELDQAMQRLASSRRKGGSWVAGLSWLPLLTHIGMRWQIQFFVCPSTTVAEEDLWDQWRNVMRPRLAADLRRYGVKLYEV